MEDVLQKIVEHKRLELAATSFGDVEQMAHQTKRKVVSMSASLRETKGGIIAEFKRKSPSKGWINRDGNPLDIVAGYREAGAAACSVLTNTHFFGGRLDDLRLARTVAGDMPLLRKEFIIDPRQVYEARVAGADAILLIAACLTVEQTLELAKIAHSVSLEVLLEVHSEDELGHLNSYIDMLGINNRNLGSFVTDINNSYKMAALMREAASDLVLVSESGIDGVDTIKSLKEAGFDGFLIGESFMKGENPSNILKEVISQL